VSEPRLVDVRSIPPEDLDLAPILEHLRAGGLLAYPTETVYGFGGVPSDDVVSRITTLKGRPSGKPMLMLIPRRETVEHLIWTDEAAQLAEVFWPGSVTLILSDPEAHFPPGVRGQSGAVAVRVSPHPLVKALVEGLDGPLVSTSANVPGEPPALDADHAMEAARTLGVGEELWVLDGGTLPESAPSTILDCSGAVPVVVRQGTVPLGRVRCVLPDIEAAPSE
jgi:L-threonylcarbamoyladenylate synthase